MKSTIFCRFESLDNRGLTKTYRIPNRSMYIKGIGSLANEKSQILRKATKRPLLYNRSTIDELYGNRLYINKVTMAPATQELKNL